MDRSLIDRFTAGGAKLATAIRGLTPSDLDAFPVPGTWSIRQIVAHMMDSDLVAGDRMKRVIAMDHPSLLSYDETAFAQTLGYDVIDVDLACLIFENHRILMGSLLHRLPTATFARTGNHSDHGPMTLENLVQVYTDHLDHHLGFLLKKRAMLGKPISL